MRPSITPLEVRKRTFSRVLRGYDRAEVELFLEILAEDLQELHRELDEKDVELHKLRLENKGFHDNELMLRETLMLAQRTADEYRKSASHEAERIIREAERHADRLSSQAMDRVSESEKKIRELRMERKNFHLKLQSMIDLFQQVLVFDREETEREGSVSVIHRRREEGGT